MYTYLWNKYRPAILRLMMDSVNGPQEYKFSNHEFRSVNPKEKGGYSFLLRAFQGKAVNDIKTSVVAKDLLVILKQSRTASELMDVCTYEFMLDKQFLLHIKKEDEVISEGEVAEEDEVAGEGEVAEKDEVTNKDEVTSTDKVAGKGKDAVASESKN